MKKFKKVAFALLTSSIILMAPACSSDDNNGGDVPMEQNIVEVALGDPELTLLVSALQAADGDLVNVLQGDGPFTVLAPTNAAFTAFLNANGFGSIDDIPSDVLEQVLLYHVIGDEVTSGDLTAVGDGYAASSSLNAQQDAISIYFNTSAGVRFNNAASVTSDGADISASNGVIHKIDAVLTLPDVVDHAIANPNFTSLVTALGIPDGLIDTLRGDGPFTVLAPTNAAFDEFLDGTDIGGIPVSGLTSVLLNHAIDGYISSDDLVALGSGYDNTLAIGPGDNNLSLYFNTSDGVTFNGTSDVVIADVVGTNGTIHAVNAVIDIPTVVTFAAADPNFSTLVAALTDLTPNTDFVSILSRTEGDNLDGINPDFTVFAPTNDAFDDLESIPGETELTQILLHHVVGEANITSGDLTNPGDTTATTLQGADITITLPGTSPNIADVTDGAGNTDIGIIAVDVQAGNGVIHVLNKVMFPN